MKRSYAFLILFALTLAAYWNSLTAPFVFDDLVAIQRNTMVRFQDFHWGLSGFFGSRALLYITFTANYWLSGQATWSFHIFNLGLHLANGWLIFLLGERLFWYPEFENINTRRRYALLAAALFLVHPIQTESVTYISSRSELLSTFFFLIGFLIYVAWPCKKGFICAGVVGIPYFLAIASKETAITLPAAILLYDWLFSSAPVVSRWRFYLTYLIGGASASYYILTVPLRDSIGSALPGHLTSWAYFLTETRVLVKYIGLIFWPANLNLDYDFIPSLTIDSMVVWCSLILFGVLLFGWKLRRAHPIFAFSIFWFFLTLAPTSSVIPIMDFIFEHRLYLPMVGICLSFPLLIEWIYSLRKELAFPFACFLILLCIGGSVQRNYVWSDEYRVLEFRR